MQRNRRRPIVAAAVVVVMIIFHENPILKKIPFKSFISRIRLKALGTGP